MIDGSLARPDIVLFDLDGTLIDSVPDLTEATNRTLRENDSPPVTAAEVRDWVGNGTWRLVECALERSEASPIDPQHLQDAYQRFHHHYAECCMDQTVIFDHADDLISHLRAEGIKTAIVTNKPDVHAQRMMAAWSSRLPMDVVIGHRDGFLRKPDPAMLRRALEQTASQSAWMVGDSDVDGQAARAIGLEFIGVRLGYNHGQDIASMQPPPSLVFDDLGALLAWFLRWRDAHMSRSTP